MILKVLSNPNHSTTDIIKSLMDIQIKIIPLITSVLLTFAPSAYSGSCVSDFQHKTDRFGFLISTFLSGIYKIPICLTS